MSAPRPPAQTVVIGGGIGGLASAALLARAGHNVTLLEKNSELGGRAGVYEEAGFRFDTGPSWYLMPEVFDHFFRLLGTSSERELDLVKLDPGYRVFFEGGLPALDIAATRAENIALFESVEAGAGARLERYLASARDTYEVAKKRFLYGTFASYRGLLRRDVLGRFPTLARLLLTPLNTLTGKYFSDPRLRQVLGYPAVFLGSSPYTAPSMYHLMSHLDLEDGVYYPRGGFGEIISAIERLAREAGVSILTEATATAILTDSADHVAGVAYTDAGGRDHTLPAEYVVGASDLHHLETRLLPERLRTYPQEYWDRAVAGPSAVLVSLGVSGELPELAHHSLFFTTDWRDNFSRIFREPTSVPDPASIYVCRPSASDDTVAPAGQENLFILVPVPADPGIGGRGSERVREIADAAISQVADWAGIPDLAGRITVRRETGPADFVDELNSWSGTALGPAHVLRQSAMFRAKNVSARVGGLVYAGGSTIPGIGLPMCLISAELVLKRWLGETGTEPLPEPPARGA